jgi:hypothetical protein
MALTPWPGNADIERLARRPRIERWAIQHPVRWGVLWGVYFALLMGFWAWMMFPNHLWRFDVLAGVVGAPIVGTTGWLAWHMRRVRLLKQS